jgi:hypothetical protein
VDTYDCISILGTDDQEKTDANRKTIKELTDAIHVEMKAIQARRKAI